MTFYHCTLTDEPYFNYTFALLNLTPKIYDDRQENVKIKEMFAFVLQTFNLWCRIPKVDHFCSERCF